MKKQWIVAGLVVLALAGAGAVIQLRPKPPEPRLPPEQAIIKNDMLDVASVKVGGEAFKLCASCHSRGTVQESKHVGPPLGGIVGARIARYSKFDYSPALQKLRGVYWTTDELDRWLRYPAGYAPGTTMKFGGMLDVQERWDLIAYLISLK
jgi:cytochrome c